MKKLLVLCLIVLFIFSCNEITGSDEEEMDVRIHVTGFGASTSGNSWQRGYVKNHSGPRIVRVKVLWSTDMRSGSVSTSPNVLNKDDEGTYYFSYIGSKLQTSISYDKE
jgi:hypothetical protein